MGETLLDYVAAEIDELIEADRLRLKRELMAEYDRTRRARVADAIGWAIIGAMLGQIALFTVRRLPETVVILGEIVKAAL